jgi:hypothetical protein
MNQSDIQAEIAALRLRLDLLEKQAATPVETPIAEMKRRYAALEASNVTLPLNRIGACVTDDDNNDLFVVAHIGLLSDGDANLAALIALTLNRLPQMIKVIEAACDPHIRNISASVALREALEELEAPL